MKLKEKFQRFWTMSKSREGFTLVELIVVIAILAILAGVAIPVYNGYIKKAQTAADQTLLDSINTSFVAACVENGFSQYEVAKAKISLDCVFSDVVLADADSTDVTEDIQAAFDFYFEGNENATFNTFQSLVYDAETCMFVGSEMASGNMTQEQIQAALNRYTGSNLAGKEDTLVGSVGTLSGMLSDQLDAGSVNLDFWMGEDYEGFMSDYGITDESTGTETANALIMYTASKMQGVTADDIIDIAGEDLSNMNKVIETYGEIPTAAMMYGVITGYANSEYASDSFKETYKTPPTGIGDVNTLLATMSQDANFETYLNNTGANGAMADMDGYLAAMEIINGHSGSFDLSDENAFTNEETLALMNSILGMQ